MKHIFSLLTLCMLALASCKGGSGSPTVDTTRPTAANPGGGTTPVCVSVDTDGDGIMDCQDPDVDNDGKGNQLPYVSINFACYRQSNSLACTNASSRAGSCEWISSNNTCVTSKSCGVILEQNKCAVTTGCEWTNNSCTQQDWFPTDKNEFIDSDFDGYGDNSDKFPADPSEWADTLCVVKLNASAWCGLLGDNVNPDDDADGVPDQWDSFPHEPLYTFDTDKDGIPNELEQDKDNDGVPDQWDDLPFELYGYFDIDHDGIPNQSDGDWDGDGIGNDLDAFPYDPTEWLDTSLKGIGNNANPDDDWDGVPDKWDDFPLNKIYYWDSDGDGVANQVDAFPYNPNEWKDTDGDGYGDNIDAFPNDPTEWKDTDGDGIGDNMDPDADNDGFYNTVPSIDISKMNLACWKQLNDATCSSASNVSVGSCTWAPNNRCVPSNSCGVIGNQANCNSKLGCEWQGNVCENQDYFPYDLADKSDFAKLGLGDNTSPDLDWDGIPNSWDEFPKNASAFVDFDQDGLIDYQLPTSTADFAALVYTSYYGYKIDPDVDNDGVPDLWDDLQFDQGESFDIDHDGIGNNIDTDRDGDGIANALDKFPFDVNEWKDTLCVAHNYVAAWCDLLGDNINPDDDYDGVPDQWDSLPSNPNGSYDMDGNGIPDQVSIDLDGDGSSNGLAPNEYVDPLIPSKGYLSPYGISCGKDTNNDGIPDTLIGRSTNSFVCGYHGALDSFIWDATETTDTDKDGIGDNMDPDADNDGVPDQWDDLPLDIRGGFDFDKDGIPDNIDVDIDGDGSLNNVESNTTNSPYGVFCGYDANNDGILDTIMVNNFTCEYRDTFDDFAWDGSEASDIDEDGIGDNQDFDADNDGVPNFWDDFKFDNTAFFDNDKDGIPNEEDIYTPNGINNQADVMTAISHGENIVLTSDITLTSCIDIPEGITVASATDDFRILYDGPNNSCVFRIMQGSGSTTGYNTTIGNVIIEVPANKTGIKVISSSGTLDEVDITQSIFRLYGQGVIANLTLNNQFRFIRNNVQLTTNYDMPSGASNLIQISSSAPTTSNYLSVAFGGNIVFWDITANQSQPVSFVKTIGAFRKITMGSNVLKLKKSVNVNFTGLVTFFNSDFDYNEAAPVSDRLGSVNISNNRVNMNAGQMLYLISSNNTLTSTRATSFGNELFGITSTGNNYTDFDTRELVGLGCENNQDKSGCLANSKCEWNSTTVTTGNYCAVNNSLAKSATSAYYDFVETDVWLNPASNDFSMFYYPNETLMQNSPALFDSGTSDEDDLNMVQEIDLGLGTVYYVGAYGPEKDTDGDRHRDEIDKFPFDPNEWRDTDNDGIGNVADTDDDNDNVLDIIEVSTCAPNQDAQSCGTNPVCTWSASTDSCRRNPNVCATNNNLISCAANNLCSWNLLAGSCDLKPSLNGCLVDGSTWDQSSKCCLSSSNECVDASDPFVIDSDGDGLTDYEELYTYNTNPLNKDTDGDGDTDGEEIANNSNPNSATSSKDTDGDGLSDKYELTYLQGQPGCNNSYLYPDTDGDGISDYEEVMNYHTNPCSADTDGDGLSDYEEIFVYMTSPTLSDTDGDGLNDYQEVKVQHTNPKVVDTDGDGASDYQEVVNGTNPLDNTSFLDTDGDGQTDYTDLTPYGVTPYPACTGSSLASCAGTFTNAQFADEFYMQMLEANTCTTKTTQATCTSTRDLCKWNGTVCSAKDIVINKDIVFDGTGTYPACFTINVNSNITIRSSKAIRKKLSLTNNLFNFASCNSQASNAPTAAATPMPFITLASTATTTSILNIDTLRMEGVSAMPKLIATKASAAKNNTITIKNSEFYSTNKNGANILFALDPLNVTIEKTTFKSLLDSTNVPVAPVSTVEIKNTDAAITSKLEIKGSLFYCDTQNQIGSMVTSSIPYSCLNTQADQTNFQGNLVYIDQANDVSDAVIDSNANNTVYAWRHVQSGTPLVIRNSRLLSQSKTLYLDSAIGVDITNLAIRNGSVNNPSLYDKTGATASISASLLPNDFAYNSLFTSTGTSTVLKCVYNTSPVDTNAEIQSGVLSPAYFSISPAQAYWNEVFRYDRNIQTLGAYNVLSCP